VFVPPRHLIALTPTLDNIPIPTAPNSHHHQPTQQQPFCAKLSCNASDCSDSATKEFPPSSSAGTGSSLSSPSSDSNRISIDELTPHLRCGLCREHVAGSLVLSCGHLFCGQCLADHLIGSPSCPACQMSLRAIPVRCSALDNVMAALLPALSPAQQDSYKRRKERGESAPSIIAKMLWWLEAGAPTSGGASEPPGMGARGHGQCGSAAGNGAMLHGNAGSQMLARAGSSGHGIGGGMMHQQLAGPLGGTQLLASPSVAAHEAAIAAAMTAAAAAAVATSAAPSFGLASQLGGMHLGGMCMGGMHGGHGLGPLAGLGGRSDVLSHGLRDQMPLPMDPMAAYLQSMQSMQSAAAMQSAMSGLHGGASFMGGGAGYNSQLGGLMGL
jgi:hypothetical protein